MNLPATIPMIPLTIQEIRIGYTYRCNDPNNYWFEKMGKCIAIFPSRSVSGVVAIHMDKNHPVHFFPQDLTLVSRTQS